MVSYRSRHAVFDEEAGESDLKLERLVASEDGNDGQPTTSINLSSQGVTEEGDEEEEIIIEDYD